MQRIRSVVCLLFALAFLMMPAASQAQIVDVNITIAPPELPIYEQPPLPAPGYIWIPGYWAWGPDGYFWVPGTWVLPPQVGLLWTPGYWAWRDGIYVWSAGYWGPHIGFYGGVNYGFGYTGVGYAGGRWNGGVFVYNSTVNNFGGVHVTNVYRETVVVNNNVRVSFNGGSGGTAARPTPQEEAAAHEQHVAPTTAQTQHQQLASSNKSLLASENHGQPAIAATTKPADFNGRGVVAARDAKPVGGLTNAKANGGPVGSNAPGEKMPGTNAAGTKTPGANLTSTKAPGGGQPGGGAGAGSNSPGPKALDRKGSVNERAMLKSNGGNAPKTLNTQAKPLSNNPPPRPVRPNPPPHVVSTPHPGPQPHPGPPPKDKKHG